jgi:methionine-rich copper-binding protein CopC
MKLSKRFAFALVPLSLVSLGLFPTASFAATTEKSVNCLTNSGGAIVTMNVGDTLVISTTGCRGAGTGGAVAGTWAYGPTGTETAGPFPGNYPLTEGHKVSFVATQKNTLNATGITLWRNAAGPILGDPEILITVIDPAPPTLSSSSPADDATGVSGSSNIVLSFSESVKAGTGNILLKKSSDNTTFATIPIAGPLITISGSTVTINPAADLDTNTGYYIEIASGVILDLSDNAFTGISGPSTLNFTTAAAPAPSSQTSGGASPLPAEPQIALDFRGRAGQPSAGAVVDVSGLSVPAGAVATVSLFAPEVKLFEQVLNTRAFSSAVALPAGLAPGSYTVVYQVLLPSGEVSALHIVVEIGDGGVITSVSENIVGSGPAGVPGAMTELSDTGVRSSSLPWWAIVTIFGGLMLILYSRRAVKMAEAFDARLDENGHRTPWEILSTPIRVPGIDYSPGAMDGAGSSQSLGEAVKGLDVAFSLIIASQIARLRTHA